MQSKRLSRVRYIHRILIMETGKKEGCSRKEWSWQEPKGLLFHRSPSLTPELPSITYHFPFPNSAHLRRVVTCCLQILFSLFFFSNLLLFFASPIPQRRLSSRSSVTSVSDRILTLPALPTAPDPANYSLFKTLFPGLPRNLWTFLLSSGWSSSVFAAGSSSSS